MSENNTDLILLGDTRVEIAKNDRGLIIPDNLTEEEAGHTLQILINVRDFSVWGLVDIVATFQRKWGETFPQWVNNSYISVNYIYNLRVLHTFFPTPEHRKWAVSASHYWEVARSWMTDRQRERLLDIAEREELTRDELRAMVRALREQEDTVERFTNIKFADAIDLIVAWAKRNGAPNDIIQKIEPLLSTFKKRIE